MSSAQPRLLTLIFNDMEVVRPLPNSYAELEALVREWIKHPPNASLTLRVPPEFVFFGRGGRMDGPHFDLTGEDSYQIAVKGVQTLRVEIITVEVRAKDRSTSASLPAPSFWHTFRPKNKDDMRNKQAQRPSARPRLITLCYGDMETIRSLPNSYAELEALVREWTTPPPDASFILSFSPDDARQVAGPYFHLTDEDSYRIAVKGVQTLLVRVVIKVRAKEQAQRPSARPRLITLRYGDMETIRSLPNSYAELDAVARAWEKPPPEAYYRVPQEYASLHATRMVAGPYIYLIGEDSYQITIMGIQRLLVQIVSDISPPPDEPLPPLTPVPEMPATFNLKLMPGEPAARLLTLAYGDMETVGLLPNSHAELDAVARDWIKPPPTAIYSLRVPVGYASLDATRLVAGPYIYLTGEGSYQIAIMGLQWLRVEIVSNIPPPPDEPLRVLSAIQKVMEDLKADTSQILLAEKAAARLHAIFNFVFSSKSSCKTLLDFRGDNAKIVLNSLQWLLDHPQSNSSQRSRLLSVLLRLSRKSGLYPECIILKDIVREDDCAVASGHFGEVWKGKFRDQEVCLKVVKIYKQSDVDRLLKVFAKEAILWSQLSHPNLLPFYGIYHLKDGHGRVCLVSPWMNHGTIKDYLSGNPRVNRVLLVSDVAAGVSYLHQEAIVHGDLKGVNILVTDSGKACLADFGLSNHVDAEMLTWTSESSANTGGTNRWRAPELFDPENEKHKSTKETDVYAFSCVCYEIFTCRVPFYETLEYAVPMKVMAGKRPSRPPKNSAPLVAWGLTDSLWRLMERCWDRNPENRPTMDNISRMAFLSSLVDNRPSGRGEPLSPPQFRGAMHGFL